MARTILLLMAMLLPAGLLSAQNDLAKRASWAPPVPAVVKAQVLDWVATQKLDEVKQLEIDALWPAEVLPQAGRGTLEHLAATIAAVDSEAVSLQHQTFTVCQGPHKGGLAVLIWGSLCSYCHPGPRRVWRWAPSCSS